MSKYSDFRIGNLVYHNAKRYRDSGEYCRIIKIDPKATIYTLRSVRTGEYFEDKLSDFEPIDFYIREWGFEEGARDYYSNSELLLHDYKEFTEWVGSGYIKEIVNGVEEIFEIDGVPKYLQAGFKVKKLDAEEWLIDGTEYNKTREIHVGLQFVHELQNIYAEEFPEIVFDTDTFLRRQLK